jgi:hypothetical protein
MSYLCQSIFAIINLLCLEQKGIYSNWRFDEERKIYSCDYIYKNNSNGESVCKVVVYQGDELRKNWVYFFNGKNEPWTRCYIKPYSKNAKPLSHWQQLNKNKDGYDNYTDKDFVPTPSDGIYPISQIVLPMQLKND